MFCFCCAQNGNTENPYCNGMEGILEAYHQSLKTVQLYGPTNFSPVVNHVARYERKYPPSRRDARPLRESQSANAHRRIGSEIKAASGGFSVSGAELMKREKLIDRCCEVNGQERTAPVTRCGEID